MTTPTTTAAPAKPATVPAAKTTAARKPRAAKPQPPITKPAPAVAPKRAPKAAPAPEPVAQAAEPKKTATDYRREIDLLIITAAGELVTAHVPAELRGQVARLIANQLHHMSTPKAGWPSAVLPTPERSDWR
jgi:hypothetical protein